MEYDVFISCKSEDYIYAEEIYNFLRENGFNVFLANKELRQMGDSEYRKAISQALKSTYHLIVFASKTDYVDSTWVYYEWDWFLVAKIKGKKPGQILSILKDISIDDINADLWKYESKSFYNYKESLLAYVETPAHLKRKEEERRIAKLEEEKINKQKEEVKRKERIFISYKRVDKNKVFKIKNKIEKQLGQKCWIDIDGIESDAQFVGVIINAINQADIFLFMYSSEHLRIEDYDNDWTIREINFAQKKKKKIVFVNIDGSQLSDWFELFFGTKQQIDAQDTDSLSHLINDLRIWLGLPPNSIEQNVETKTIKVQVKSHDSKNDYRRMSNQSLNNLCNAGDKNACIEIGNRYFLGSKGKGKSNTMAQYYWEKAGLKNVDGVYISNLSNLDYKKLENDDLLSLCKENNYYACVEMGYRYYNGIKGKGRSISMANYYWQKVGFSL